MSSKKRDPKIESFEPLILMSASINGTEAADWISGDHQDNIIQAMGGDDAIHAPLGDNTVYGGDGDDAFVVYEGNSDQYEVIRYESEVVTVFGPGLNGQINQNVLVDVEAIHFNDRLVQTGLLEVSRYRAQYPVGLRVENHRRVW